MSETVCNISFCIWHSLPNIRNSFVYVRRHPQSSRRHLLPLLVFV